MGTAGKPDLVEAGVKRPGVGVGGVDKLVGELEPAGLESESVNVYAEAGDFLKYAGSGVSVLSFTDGPDADYGE